MNNIKPILFSTPMVQAILDGRKTMTRRVIKTDKDGVPTAAGLLVDPDNDWCAGRLIKPPYQPGDILWVRETWMQDEIGYLYKNSLPYLVGDPIWKPSIFMPKEACRIWLRVTGVRAERLTDISHDDVLREGIPECQGRLKFPDETCCCADLAFEKLWDEINAKRGFGWGENPWVWVISFERCEKPEGWGIA